MTEQNLDEYPQAEKDRLAREEERMAGRKSARDMTPEEWKQAQARLGKQQQKPKQLPDARTLTDAEFRQALGKFNLSR